MSILLSIPTKNRLRWLCLKSWSTLIYQGLSIQRLKRTPGSFKVPPKKNYIRPYIGLIYGRYLQFRFLKWPLTMDPVVLSEYDWGLVSRPPSRTSLQYSDPQDKNRATPAPAPALGVAGVNVRPDKWWESAVPGWKISMCSRNIMEQN